MSSVVCDASVLFKVLISDTDSDLAESLLLSTRVIVPELVYAELGNAIWVHLRRTHLELDAGILIFDALPEPRLEVRPFRPHLRRALLLANRLNHPIYDCLYLALAESLDLPLVTADARFVAAVRRAPFTSVQVRTLAEFVG